MTGFNKKFLIAGVLLLVAATPAISSYAASVSGNEVDMDDGVIDDEGIVSDEEADQPSDPVDPEPVVSVSGNDPGDDSDPEGAGDEENVSGNDVPDHEQPDLLDDYLIVPLSDYDSYYGTISTTYVEYFRGYLSRLEPTEHYVAARVGQYEYIFAYGSELYYDSGSFYGEDVYVVTFYTSSNGSFSGSLQPTFSLDPGNNLIYTDLTYLYPSLATSSDISLRQLVLVAAVSIAFLHLAR